MIDLVLSAGWAARSVLIVLFLASIVSWAVIGCKWVQFLRVTTSNRRFLNLLSNAQDVASARKIISDIIDGPMALFAQTLFVRVDTLSNSSNGYPPAQEILSVKLKGLERTSQSLIEEQICGLEGHLHLLATLGNTAPFVGLFGTVWGIMGSFQEIGRQGSTSIAAVAPGIAEALIATAAGLFVAIPAVVAYNLFVNSLKNTETQLQSLSAELLSLIEEDLIKNVRIMGASGEKKAMLSR